MYHIAKMRQISTEEERTDKILINLRTAVTEKDRGTKGKSASLHIYCLIFFSQREIMEIQMKSVFVMHTQHMSCRSSVGIPISVDTTYVGLSLTSPQAQDQKQTQCKYP